MVEAGEVAVAAAFGFGLEQDHGAGGGGADRRPCRHGDVDPLVHAPQRRPKPETTGAVDRPDQARRCRRWIGPAGSGATPVAASWAASFALDLGHVAVELFLVFADPASARRLALRAGGDQRRLALCSGGAGARQRLLFGGDRVAGGFDPVLGAAQAGDDALAPGRAGRAPGRRRLVHAVQAVEVFGAVDQVVDSRRSRR